MKLSIFLWRAFSVICIFLIKDTLMKEVVRTKKRSKPEPQIIGGTEAVIGQFPYFVSLQRIFYGQHYCGGSIISAWMILTAAHCVYKDPIHTITAVAGFTDLRLSLQGMFLYPYRYFIYPYYNPVTFEGDVGIIQLRYPVWDSPSVQAIQLMHNYPSNDMKSLEHATVVGFGANNSIGFNNKKLNFVEVPLWDRKQCNIDNFELIRDSMLCGGTEDGTKNSCRGDSGGPVVMKNILIGVISWGYKCGEEKKPSVFAYVGYYRNWIREVAGV